MKYFKFNLKTSKMKKFFAIAILATAFVACNSGGEKKEEKKDTTVAPAPAPAPADTTAKPAADTTAKPAADTTKK